jgi:hypothetical protein
MGIASLAAYACAATAFFLSSGAAAQAPTNIMAQRLIASKLAGATWGGMEITGASVSQQCNIDVRRGDDVGDTLFLFWDQVTAVERAAAALKISGVSRSGSHYTYVIQFTAESDAARVESAGQFLMRQCNPEFLNFGDQPSVTPPPPNSPSRAAKPGSEI